MTRGDLKQYLRANNKKIGCIVDIETESFDRFILLDADNDVSDWDYLRDNDLLDDYCIEYLLPQQAMDEGLISLDQFETGD